MVPADGDGGRDSRPPLPEPLPHPVVDNHCHLDMSAQRAGTELPVDEALRLADSVGVTRVVQIGCDLPGARWAVQVAQEHAAVVAGVALHPNEAPRLADSGDLDDALAEIDRLAGSSERVRAVGETGLDYFRTEPPGRDAQHASFRAHIALAKKHAKTLVVHDREAHDDVLRILDEEGAPQRVVMHCFSGDETFAKRCVERGFWLSYAGTVTFRNAQSLRDALAVTPPDRMLVETDAPFLTPMPYRGRPNASYLVPLTVRSMADTLGVDLAGLCRLIDANTEQAFGGSW
jgi:TatD DNase family protein